PQCQQRMVVAPELRGRKVRCPQCRFVLLALAELNADPGPGGDVGSVEPPTGDHPASIFAEPAESDHAVAAPQPAIPEPEPVELPDFAFEPPGLMARQATPAPIASPRPPVAGSGRRPSDWMLGLCLPYALLMTAVAIYYYYQYRAAGQLHPLELFPDVLGEYKNATTKGR